MYMQRIFKVIDWLFRFRYALGVFVLAIAVLFSLHFSSIGQWDMLVPGGPGQKNINIIGESRPIRSDEFLGRTVMLLAQTKSDDFYPLVNQNFGDGMNMFLANAPVFDISLVGRPQFWGFILFGAERGFSWFWWMRLLLLFFTSFELLRFFTKDKRLYSLVGAILITFAPLTQWWFVEIFIDLIFFFQLTVVCLVTYFKVHESLFKRILCLLGMAIGMCGYAFSFFPAVMIPLFIIMLMLIGYILWSNREKIKKLDIFMAAGCVLLTGAVVAVSFWRSWDALQATLNINQANRFALPGTFDIRYQMYEFFSFGLPFRDSPLRNNCEISRFITLMPLTLLLFPMVVSFKKKANILPIGLYSLLLVLCVWAYIPMPQTVGKLFSYVTTLFLTTRIQILMGLLGVYILTIIFCARKKAVFSLPKKILLSLFGGCCVMFITYAPDVNAQYTPYTVLLVLFFLACMLLLIWGKPKWSAILLGLTVLLVGIQVNPIARGLDPIYNKSISYEVQKVQAKDPDAQWLAVINLHHNFLPALGVDCYNTVQLTPFLEQWESLDPEKKYDAIYNRYAFVSARLTEEATGFEELGGDHILLNLNTKDLQKTGSDYILADRDITEFDSDDVTFENLCTDFHSGYRIYRIHYAK